MVAHRETDRWCNKIGGESCVEALKAEGMLTKIDEPGHLFDQVFVEGGVAQRRPSDSEVNRTT